MSPGIGLRPIPPPLLHYAVRPTVLIRHHRGVPSRGLRWWGLGRRGTGAV